jgi:hypothetical protein
MEGGQGLGNNGQTQTERTTNADQMDKMHGTPFLLKWKTVRFNCILFKISIASLTKF